MIRTPANFFHKCEKFAKDSGIGKKERRIGILEYSKRKPEFA